MTSQINPADIDGNYPIAGVSNNTQGMRDNFTNTRTNFQYASDEITDLQNNAVLKAALSGTTLDNNLGNNVVYNALVKGISGTVVVSLPEYGSATYEFKNYSGCTLSELQRSDYFVEHTQDVRLLIRNIVV